MHELLRIREIRQDCVDLRLSLADLDMWNGGDWRAVYLRLGFQLTACVKRLKHFAACSSPLSILNGPMASDRSNPLCRIFCSNYFVESCTPVRYESSQT